MREEERRGEGLGLKVREEERREGVRALGQLEASGASGLKRAVKGC